MDDDLIEFARAVAGPAGPGRPRDVRLRRAASSIYYAMFHSLAALCANSLVGATARNAAAWIITYRALNHGKAKSELEKPTVRQLHVSVDGFAQAFVDLQEERHTADYDPSPYAPKRRDVIAMADRAAAAIQDLRDLPPELRKDLAATLLFQRRQ